MPKNIMKLNIFLPKRSTPISVCIHFDPKYLGGQFYFDLMDLPSQISEGMQDYVQHELKGRTLVYGASVEILKTKIDQAIASIQNGYAKIESREVIRVSFDSGNKEPQLFSKRMFASAECQVLTEKTFFNSEGSIQSTLYYSKFDPKKEVSVNDVDIIVEYTEENENDILKFLQDRINEWDKAVWAMKSKMDGKK